MNRFDGSTITTLTKRDGLTNNIITCVVEDQNGSLVLGSLEGVNILRKDSSSAPIAITQLTEKEGLSGKFAGALVIDKNNNLWIGTQEGGITRLKMGSEKSKYGAITNLSEMQGLINNNVTSVSEDKSGNLWFGTRVGLSQFKSGVSVTDPGIFNNYTSNEGLPFNDIKSTLYDHSGNLWIGTEGAGASKFDGKTFTNYSSGQLVDGTITHIKEDDEGSKWFATYYGVSRLDNRSVTDFTTNNGLLSNVVISLFKDNAGDMWFGTLFGGVVKYHLSEKPDFKNAAYPANETFTIYTDKEGLSNNSVLSIHQDQFGNMWFGTLDGLNRFDGECFAYFTKNEGLSSNAIMSIADNGKSRLLIGTPRGLDYLEINQGEQRNNKTPNVSPISSFRIKRLSQAAGLKAISTNSNSTLVDSKSSVWAGTTNGLINFERDASFFNSNPPEIHLTGLDIDGKFIDFRKLPTDLL